MKRLIISLLCATAAIAADPKPPVFPADIKVERNVAYLPEGRAEKADLYLPLEFPKDKKLPGVVIIHGGGWIGGLKDAAREINIGSTLVRAGYVAMSIEYVLFKDGPTTWPQNLWDCKTAVRWMRANADRLHLDVKHIGVIGGSAGGHLAAMVAVTEHDDGLDPKEPFGDLSCQVQCAVDLYGPSDLAARGKDAPWLGKTFAEAPDLYREVSPAFHVNKGDPPLLIMHGTADTTVDIEQSKILDKACAEAGIEHQLVIVEGAPHTFDLQPKQQDLRPIVIGFFNKHLKP